MWGELSPGAAKACSEAAARARGCRPRLARTQDKAIVEHLLSGGRHYQLRFAQGVVRLLPLFTFNSQRKVMAFKLAGDGDEDVGGDGPGTDTDPH